MRFSKLNAWSFLNNVAHPEKYSLAAMPSTPSSVAASAAESALRTCSASDGSRRCVSCRKCRRSNVRQFLILPITKLRANGKAATGSAAVAYWRIRNSTFLWAMPTVIP